MHAGEKSTSNPVCMHTRERWCIVTLELHVVGRSIVVLRVLGMTADDESTCRCNTGSTCVDTRVCVYREGERHTHARGVNQWW